MPSKSLTPEEKAKVTSAIPTSINKILTAVPARIYCAHPQRDKWSYTGLQGALAFTYDRSKDAFDFKLVDFTGTRGIMWHHELYAQFEYNKDRPFFHSFSGDECMIGVVFADEKDADLFYKKVATRKANKVTKASPEPQKTKKGGKIDKSMISAPQSGSFRHVAHVGYDAEKGYSSNNVDESWLSIVQGLECHGFTAKVIEDNKEFIQDFVRNAQKSSTADSEADAPPKKKPPPPPIPRRAAHAVSGSVTSTNGDTAPAPPLPPQPALPNVSPPTNGDAAPSPPYAFAKQPPRPIPPIPLPPQRTPPAPPNPPVPPPPARPPPPSRPVASTPSPPIPQPPVRPAATPSPPVRPQPVARPPPTSTPPPPPPPPPPLPDSKNGGSPPPQDIPPPPPPPPPPVVGVSMVPPPPPPANVGAAMTTPQPGRAALLESIRNPGNAATLRKTGGPTSAPPPPPPAPAVEEASTSNGAVAGGDLTAALAAALLQRSKKLGDSDNEDDDEEWD